MSKDPVREEFVENQSLPPVEPDFPNRGRYGSANLRVLLLQVAGWALLLTGVESLPGPWPLRVALVLAFCLVMQGVFSMMHEHFHRNAHRNRAVNYLIGSCGSLIFGTSATLHRVQHWGHHLRNRSVAERGEFIHPGESAWLKVFLYYFAVLGGLWVAGLIFPYVALCLPYRSAALLARTRRFNTYAAAFDQFGPRDWHAVQLEAIALAGFWSVLIWLRVWSWQTLLVCYGGFAVSWSSLQWVYHVRTPLHVVEGAYNLRTGRLIGALLLNFNYNLTHHRDPSLAWQELPGRTELRETQPLWFRWIRILLPPVRIPSDPAVLEQRLRKSYF